MFTGIIEEVGEIVEISDAADFRVLRVRARDVLGGMMAGSSIATNGVCITARTIDDDSFTADLSHETLERTTFRYARTGTAVNLERSMRADGRFGGHIVQGHVDGVGRIRGFTRSGDNWDLNVEYPDAMARYIVEKGSIAVDGISLTVAGLGPGSFSVAIIPHTLEHTNLQRAEAGDAVNIEVDVIAKYVERLIGGR